MENSFVQVSQFVIFLKNSNFKNQKTHPHFYFQDLPILTAEPPKGDDLGDDVTETTDGQTDISCSLTETDENKSMSDVEESDRKRSTGGGQSKLEKIEEEDKLKDVEPLNFPLYSIFGGKAENQTPCGQVPLVFYWVKRLRPRTFDRFAGKFSDSCVQ